MKQFDLKIFMIATFAMIVLNIASGMTGILWAEVRFPIFTLFWKYIYSQPNVLLIAIALFLNCAFYGVIFERIFYLFRKKSKLPLVPTRI